MKTCENKKSFLLLVTIGTMAFSLMSCATTENNFHEYDRESFFKGNSTDLFDKQAAHVPDEEATLQDPPGWTSDEHERLGDHYLDKGNLVMAFVQYEKSKKINPDNTRIYYKKGLLSISAEKYEDAVKEFQEVLAKDPAHALAHHGLGQACFQMKKYDEAEAHAQEALEFDASLWQAHNLLGIIYNHKKRHDEAIPAYKAAIALKPDDGLLYNNLGISYSAVEEHEKAVTSFTKALQTKSSHTKIYNNLGLALSKLGRYQEAFEAFRKGGDEAQAYNNIGCMYLWRGDYDKAEESLKKAIELRATFYDKASDNLKKCRSAQLKQTEILEPSIQSSQMKENLTEYAVQKGDTLYKIAKRFGTTTNAISTYNQLTTPMLNVGQVLIVPEQS
jgi:Flp pilus assembly protein TadD